MKVLILLSGRFPTEKAYGVTTTGTIKSLIKFGHDVHVFALSSEYEDGSIPSPFYSQHLYKENILTSSLRGIPLLAYPFPIKLLGNLADYFKVKFKRD